MAPRWRAVLVTMALVAGPPTTTSTAAAASSALHQLGLGHFVHGDGWSAPPRRAAGSASTIAPICPGGYSFEHFAQSESVRVAVTLFCSDSRGHGALPPAPGVTYSGDLYATMATGGSYDFVGRLGTEFRARNVYVLGGVFDIRYCSLAGGSDLPGAVLRTRVDVQKPAHVNVTDQYTLLDDKAPPVLSGGSTPPHATVVHPGQLIRVHVTATEPSNEGPQEGVRDIQLLGPAGLISSALYGNHPKACDLSRLTKTLTTTYTVPANPPSVIRLTAVAHDFANNESAMLSADFPTGNVWMGTMHVVIHSTHPNLCPATIVLDSTISLVVGDKGDVHGTRSQVLKETTCGPGVHQGPLTLPVPGQLTGGQFHFTGLVDGYPIETNVPLSPSKRTAKGQLHVRNYEAGDGYTLSWNGTISLACTTC
jgi:hypothetical protein